MDDTRKPGTFSQHDPEYPWHAGIYWQECMTVEKQKQQLAAEGPFYET